MTTKLDTRTKRALFEYMLRLGDDRLVLGHRLSEWCGHAPILEEDIALANFALDCLGQASNLLKLAGRIEGNGRSEDDLAYFREAVEFRNAQLVELPKGDFAFTIIRQFLFDAYSYHLFEELRKSNHEKLAAIAEKSVKEDRYHIRHTGEWILRFGIGTDESRSRALNALEDLWMYTDELFYTDDVDSVLIEKGIVPDQERVKSKWQKMTAEVFTEATLIIPENNRYMASGSRQGRHSEHLGHLLAEMQIVARSFPGAKW